MKQLLAFALPVCFLISCSSEPAKDDAATTEETRSEDTITGIMNPPEKETGPETKKLPVPEAKDLKGDLNDYDYLVKYIGDPGKKNVKKPHIWSQTFGEDITYDMINGIESNGYNYRITFAGYPKEEVVQFVEWFQSAEDMGWDKEKTVYGPKDENALGCFYYVKQDKKGNYYMDCICVC